MIETTSEIHNIDFDSWDSFVKTHPKSTVFQSPEMYEVFIKSKNFEPVLITAKQDGKLAGLILAVIIREYSGLHGFFSSRTVIYGGPLIDEAHPNYADILESLLTLLIKEVKNRTIFIQFRNFYEFSQDRIAIYNQFGFKFMDRLNYLVDTSSETVVKKRISKSKLRQVKKGLETGAEIIDPENEKQIREFYTILYNLYKKKVKKPLPNYSFFQNFYFQTLNNKTGIIKLIKFENKIIGGILSPVTRDKTIYEWYVCGLDQEYKQAYPSVLATWAAIDYALQNNIAVFDFMGVGVPDRDYGVREFKSKFGGELVNFGRFGRINNQFIYAITEIGFNVLALLRKI